MSKTVEPLSRERINELLAQLDKELNKANDELTDLMEQDDHEEDTEFMDRVDYWTSEITRIQNELQSLLKSL